jgi:hypothetical protein
MLVTEDLKMSLSKDTKYFVYLYLREKDSATAKAGTPYYAGKGCGKRAYEEHRKNGKGVHTPKNQSNIVFLKENLTEAEAHSFEIETIAKYGRKDLKTGILHNQTNGGEGGSGRIDTPETTVKRKLGRVGVAPRVWTAEEKQKQSLNHVGINTWTKGSTQKEETINKRVAKLVGQKRSTDFCDANSKIHKGKALAKNPITNELLGKICLTDPRWKTKEIVGASLNVKKGPQSLQHRANTSLALKGMKYTPQKRDICPHCNKEFGLSNLKKYHLDKCKLKAREIHNV